MPDRSPDRSFFLLDTPTLHLTNNIPEESGEWRILPVWGIFSWHRACISDRHETLPPESVFYKHTGIDLHKQCVTVLWYLLVFHGVGTGVTSQV